MRGVEEGVALGPQIEGSDAGLGVAANDLGRARVKPHAGFGARTRGHESSEENPASRHLGFRRSENQKAAVLYEDLSFRMNTHEHLTSCLANLLVGVYHLGNPPLGRVSEQ